MKGIKTPVIEKSPICIVPARSGSKGLKNKNMLFLEDKPLLFHTIDEVINSGIIEPENIFVSTDSVEYKAIIESARPVKVLLREEEYASDTATTLDFLLNFFSKYPEVNDFILCQPTSPLRSGNTIRNAYATFKKEKCDNLVSFSESDKSLRLFSRINKDGCPEDVIGIDKAYARQNEEKYYYPNGALFISTKDKYIKYKSFFTEETFAYLINKEEAVDIDDMFDFMSVIGLKHAYSGIDKCEIDPLNNNLKLNKIFIGDQRVKDVVLKEFTNLSYEGLTIKKTLENIEKILKENPSEIIIALGTNDLIAGDSIDSIRENLEKLTALIKSKNIQITLSTILLTLFRHNIENESILELNKIIKTIAKEQNIKLIEPNLLLSENGHLQFKYTTDGINLNKVGINILSDFHQKNI